MPGVSRTVFESLTSVQYRHVVDEAEIAAFYPGGDFMLACNKMNHVEGLGLCFCETRDSGCSLVKWHMSDQQPARERCDELVVVVKKDRPGVIRRGTAESNH